MIVLVIMIFTMLVFMGSLVYSYGKQSIKNGKYYLGITLGEQYINEPETKEIVKHYFATTRIINCIALLGCFVNIAFWKYTSIMLLYIMFYFIAGIIVYEKVLRKYAWMLYNLKIEKHWSEKDDKDGDIYWLKYKENPYKTDKLKKKRMGMYASTNNKVAGIVISSISCLFVIAISIVIMRFDFAKIVVSETENSVKFEAAGMHSEIQKNEIKDVKLVSGFPEMDKTVGYDGAQYYFGKFNVNGYGECTVYVCRHTKEIIVINTSDSCIIVNGTDNNKTEEIYNMIAN